MNASLCPTNAQHAPLPARQSADVPRQVASISAHRTNGMAMAIPIGMTTSVSAALSGVARLRRNARIVPPQRVSHSQARAQVDGDHDEHGLDVVTSLVADGIEHAHDVG